jgi:hypothetical protein
MRRRQVLVALVSTGLPAALAGCLTDDTPGDSTGSTRHGPPRTDGPAGTTTTTLACDAPSTLALRDPEYDLGSTNETPPLSTADLTEHERTVVEQALPPETYETCGDASALRSLADRIEARHDLRWERHRERWTEQGATVTPPVYLQGYYLEHDGRTYRVELVVDGEVALRHVD